MQNKGKIVLLQLKYSYSVKTKLVGAQSRSQLQKLFSLELDNHRLHANVMVTGLHFFLFQGACRIIYLFYNKKICMQINFNFKRKVNWGFPRPQKPMAKLLLVWLK